MKPRKKVTDPQSISNIDIANKHVANPYGVSSGIDNCNCLLLPAAAVEDDPSVAATDTAGISSGNSKTGTDLNIV